MIDQPVRPVLIGVTGNIACGKSLVMSELAALGSDTIDADLVYHELIRPGQPLHAALVDHFGAAILAPDGTIDRRALGAIVFANPAQLAALDRLTHPAVIDAITVRIARSTADVIAVDAVKLSESGMGRLCDRVWLVTCSPEQQIVRLIARNGIPTEEAQRRIAAQPPRDPAAVDAVIDNSGRPESTRAQVRALWHALR